MNERDPQFNMALKQAFQSKPVAKIIRLSSSRSQAEMQSPFQDQQLPHQDVQKRFTLNKPTEKIA